MEEPDSMEIQRESHKTFAFFTWKMTLFPYFFLYGLFSYQSKLGWIPIGTLQAGQQWVWWNSAIKL